MNSNLSHGHVDVLATYNTWLNSQSLQTTTQTSENQAPSCTASLPRIPPPSLQGAHEPIYSAQLASDATSCPPPYSASDADLPSYTEEDEPETLARSLFFYGFLLPLFWIFGAFMLFSKLEPTASWEEGKTESAKKHLLESMRRAERRWAYRCLWALLGLSAAAVLIVLIVKFSILSRS
ncbi:hypothetical protein SISNIDRAFT_454582 [Sistotremastrum niveocremeum HHB9708]|uniref:Uncharacterized protein n=2 Tax=Sistotremastraceae TaxID=3402574 RepID=A0A164UNX9_9AGAM|nr:hypothetical protein SISNIDRAFT_454582 [Sistotremastrum niveocremeum HHB9708]KZT43788.1 hypothetical protein SISSUDRAFT_1039685 [Sistotremastrum suecicum HHB10207 ss-3]